MMHKIKFDRKKKQTHTHTAKTKGIFNYSLKQKKKNHQYAMKYPPGDDERRVVERKREEERAVRNGLVQNEYSKIGVYFRLDETEFFKLKILHLAYFDILTWQATKLSHFLHQSRRCCETSGFQYAGHDLQ